MKVISLFSGCGGLDLGFIKAVPPILAFHIAKEFIKIIDKKDVKFKNKNWELPWLKKIDEL